MQRILPWILLLLAASAGAPAQTRDTLPVPDVGRYKTLKCDFHMHTVFSDGDVWPTTRVVEAWHDGLDAIAITDHNHYRPHKADVSEDIARPYAIARDVAGQLGLILIPAVEFAEGDLHANALFVADPNAFNGLKLAEAFAQARKQNAFTFWNHPGWKETPQWFAPIAAAYDAKQLDGIEIVNGRTFYKEAYPWIGEKKLTILSNSDVHSSIRQGYERRERPITLVFAETPDAEGIRAALLARRTAAWMGGEIWGPEDLLRGLWDGALKISGTEVSARRAGIFLLNRSALPFAVKIAKTPSWLNLSVFDVAPERTTGFVVTVSRNAPAGRTTAQVELEIANFHIAPDRNLTITLPVTVDIRP